MDSIEIGGVVLGGLRLDIPSEKQLAALVSAWDDDANHQVSFLRLPEFRAARGSSEYASMIASADLALSASPALSKRAAEAAVKGADDGGGIKKRSVPIGARRKEFLSYFGAPEENEESFQVYQPLKTLSLLLSVLEQRRGSVFLVGGSARTLQKAEMNVRATFPELRIVGRVPGDYPENDEASIMRALQKSTPDIVIVGSMVRGGELWIPRHMRYTRSGIFLYEASIMEILAGIR